MGIRTRSDQSVASDWFLPVVHVSPAKRSVVRPHGFHPAGTMTPWSSSPRREEFASFLGQLQGCALPLVETLRVGPVDMGGGDAVERGDGVTRTPAGRTGSL